MSHPVLQAKSLHFLFLVSKQEVIVQVIIVWISFDECYWLFVLPLQWRAVTEGVIMKLEQKLCKSAPKLCIFKVQWKGLAVARRYVLLLYWNLSKKRWQVSLSALSDFFRNFLCSKFLLLQSKDFVGYNHVQKRDFFKSLFFIVLNGSKSSLM